MAGICYVAFNSMNIVISNALAKIKTSTQIWIHISSMYIVQHNNQKFWIFAESKILWFPNISSHNEFPLYNDALVI